MRAGRVLPVPAALAALWLACASLPLDSTPSRLPVVGERPPVVFVPGVTGSKLRDPRTSNLIWGGTRQLFLPRDGGYQLVLPVPTNGAVDRLDTSADSSHHPQARYVATEPIWQLPFPGWTKMIYRPLLERFQEAGYRLGELTAPSPEKDLYFFNYDWRFGNLHSVRQLDRQLELLSKARGRAEVDIVCQSNAAKICRWIAKYGALDADQAEAGIAWKRGYKIRKLVLAGVSNGGALRVLKLLNQGRSYVPLFGRRLYPETFFSIRPLFEDLPGEGNDLFFDESGKTVTVDLFEPENWPKYGWSIFGRAADERLRREPRTDLFGSPRERLDYLREQLAEARRLQLLLSRDSPHFGSVRYYGLENASSPTIDRALLTRESGEWRTYFLGDPRVDRHPKLKRLASAPGDGHAVLASQRELSPQENAAIAGTAKVEGRHFEAIIQPDALEVMLAFLAEPTDPEP